MEKNLRSSVSGPGTQNLQKKQGKQWMRCIRQCWIMDGTENGSCVPMMHSLKRLVQKNAKKERFLLNHRDSVLWQESARKKE